MLTIQQLHVNYGDVQVLKDINLTVEDGEIICLLGHSGSGKTTLLRAIAGLESPLSGDIFLNQKRINNISVHEREVGYLFQDYALFPHMTVFENIAFGLKMSNFDKIEINRLVHEMLETISLREYANRPIQTLSGGEQQRVALARSLILRPKLLMLDEPLGALDYTLRSNLLIEIRNKVKEANIPTLYVTHDQQEAFAIADRIAVLNNGKLIEIAPPHKLYESPQTVYVAEFLGLNNIFEIQSHNQDHIQTTIGSLNIQTNASHLLLHPAKLSLTRPNQEYTKYAVTVEQILYQGTQSLIHVRLEDSLLIVFHHNQSPLPSINDKVNLYIPDNALVPLSANS